MKKILLILPVLISVLSLSAQDKAGWVLHNRQLGEYPAVWTVEAGSGDSIRIVDRDSGQPLLGEDCEWVIGGFDHPTKENAGWYTLSKEGARSDMNLVLTSDGFKYSGCDRVSDFSAHWTFLRIDSETVPYVISADGVRESSFLGERSATALSDTEIVSDYHGERHWKLSKDISAFPKFTAKENKLVPALYNMALEETLLDIRPQDGTFMAGALWPDTWTRDVVYSIYFAYSWILPEVSRRTLEKQTLKNPREALQDTGSGGSWPISTDRVVWALAAWEYWLATGDKDWLGYAYEGLSYTAKKDLHVAYDTDVHLFRGETCSMDWRTHTYPNWFTNANIGESFSSGTNALHWFLYRFLLAAGREISAPEEELELWSRISDELRQGINNAFFDEKSGLYGCWLYPDYLGYRVSSKVGDMSNGLAALLGVADEEQARRILAGFPMYAYGAAVLYPSKPDGYSYHNKSIWPVWQTPMLYASKKYGNAAVTEHLVNSAVRSGALFLTHKENMTYDTGYDRNTVLNSDRQLWSVASYLSIVYRVLFGMDMTPEGLGFHPVVPDYMGSEIELTDFRYRRATIDVKVKGTGNEIASIKVNGRNRKTSYVLPANARGKYSVEIVMKHGSDTGSVNIVPAGPGNCWAPVEPVVRLENNNIFWSIEEGCSYRLYGKDTVVENIHSPFDISSLPDGYYSISAVSAEGFESDLSNPVLKSSRIAEYELNRMDFREDHKDFDIGINIPEDGDYVLWFTGRNGHGPHDVYCTVRSLFFDGKDMATIFLEAYGDWNVSTLSNHIVLKDVKAGEHRITVRLNPEEAGYDNNMSYNRSNFNDWIVDKLTIAAL